MVFWEVLDGETRAEVDGRWSKIDDWLDREVDQLGECFREEGEEEDVLQEMKTGKSFIYRR